MNKIIFVPFAILGFIFLIDWLIFSANYTAGMCLEPPVEWVFDDFAYREFIVFAKETNESQTNTLFMPVIAAYLWIGLPIAAVSSIALRFSRKQIKGEN